MRFVARNTNIPIPSVWTSFKWRSVEYVVMSHVPGVTLEDILRNSKSGTIEYQETIVEQLRCFVAQLRSLQSPYGASICSVLGGSVYDHRLRADVPSGPYRDEQHMNLQLRNAHPLECLPDNIIPFLMKLHPIVFTHGDIAPRNIIVQGNRITLIDWETAGWFPAHWEFCKARFSSWGPSAHIWDNWIPMIIPPFELEFAVDTYLCTEGSIPHRDWTTPENIALAAARPHYTPPQFRGISSSISS
jgi:serine/threonine protein kinase